MFHFLNQESYTDLEICPDIGTEGYPDQIIGLTLSNHKLKLSGLSKLNISGGGMHQLVEQIRCKILGNRSLSVQNLNMPHQSE